MLDSRTSHFSIYAFGPLGIQTESELLSHDDLGGRKPRLLLERLVVGRNSVVHKSAIADALWPRKAPQNSSATIESYVSLLRKRLFEDRDLARLVIVTSSEGYRLNTDAINLDLDRFDELTQRADTLGPGQESLRLRMEADALRRGAVLEDALGETWIEDVRYAYHDRASLNLVMIAKAQLGANNYAAAIRCAESAVELEPYSEEAFRVVMLSQYALGHHSSARRTFERLRELVWNDLAVDLTQVTEDLAGSIDAGECPSELISQAAVSPGAVETINLSSTPDLVEASVDFRAASRRLPFLGRNAEIAAVQDLIENQARDGLRIAVISGSQGMGKTDLLNKLEEGLQGEVHRTNYAELAGSRRHYFAEGFLRALGQLDKHDLPLRLGSSDTASAGNAVLGRVADSLRRSNPITVLLDDLDHADDSDFLAIRWLQANAADVPLTIIATSGPPSWLVGGSERQIEADLELELGPLTEADVAPCGAAGKKVRQLCKGNPHFMADMWRWRAAGLSGPPESLLAYVERRMHTMNEPLIDALHILTKLCSPDELQGLVDELQDSLQTVNRGLSVLALESPTLTVGSEDERLGAA